MKWQDYEAAHPIVVADTLLNPHPITRCTAERRGIAMPSADPLETSETRYFGFNVSAYYADQALRIVDAFIRACEERGFDLQHDTTNSRHDGLSVFIDGEPVPIGLYQRGSKVPYLSFEYGRHSSTYVPNKIWKDRWRRPLAGKLNTIMLALRVEVATRIARRLDQEEYERKMAALVEQRKALHKAMKREQRKVEGLYEEANDWQLAQTVRAYVKVVEAQPAKRQEKKARAVWCQWARDQADRLDPLSISPPSILDTHRDAYREPKFHEYLELDGMIQLV